MYFLVWCWEWFGDLLFICWCCISCCKLCFVIKWLSPPFYLSMSFALYLRHGCGKRMVYYFRGSYRAPRWILYFEGRIALREAYYLSRVVSCAATDAWTDMSPMGPGLRDSGCVSLGKTCITILDFAFHCIAHTYYWWTWTCVLFILWVFLCEACDCWILSCYWECVNW